MGPAAGAPRRAAASDKKSVSVDQPHTFRHQRARQIGFVVGVERLHHLVRRVETRFPRERTGNMAGEFVTERRPFYPKRIRIPYDKDVFMMTIVERADKKPIHHDTSRSYAVPDGIPGHLVRVRGHARIERPG